MITNIAHNPSLSPPDSTRVIIVVNRDSFFLSHRLPIAIALKARGYDVIIVAEDTGYSKKIARHGLQFIPLPIKRRGRNPFTELRTLFFLINTYRRLKPKIVHHVTPKPVFWGSIAARFLGSIRSINAIAGLGSSLKRSTSRLDIQQWIVKRLYATALAHSKSRAIFMNEDDLQAFENFGLIKDRKKTVVIRGSGVDLNKFKPSPKIKCRDSLCVMFASRILIDKGIGEFVESARILKNRFRDVRFVIVGDRDSGNPSNPSDDFFSDLTQDSRLEYWGYHENMENIFTEADIVVLPTYGEGLPKALLEAAACAKPIVATNVSGCRECVLHLKTGILVPAKNVAALTDAIAKLIESPQLRESYGKAGRDLVERNFAVERVITETLQVYDSLL